MLARAANMRRDQVLVCSSWFNIPRKISEKVLTIKNLSGNI